MPPPLKILHVLRAPVGGLFRHVRDLSREQSRRGHLVGIVCDARANDSLTQTRLDELAPSLALGVLKTPMAREIDWRDVQATRAVTAHARATSANVLHGHGAKGGAYARLAAAAVRRRGGNLSAFYTPHGGSLHYAPASLKGRIFMGLERRLAAATSGIIFESAYAGDVYARNVDLRVPVATRIIHNGIGEDELQPVAPAGDAADFVFVGELRHLKGVDLLLEALSRLDGSTPATAVIVGEGPDAAAFREKAAALGLDNRVRFTGAMPARRAFALGRVLVMPSRAESLPYIVLEAAGAGLPIIATRVGGVGEIVAGTSTRLVEPDDVAALAGAMQNVQTDPEAAKKQAAELRSVIAEQFTIGAMTASVLDFYADIGAADAHPHEDATARTGSVAHQAAH
ncbi:MAG: glycosyltransferase family 4 protein [Hyphomicrobiaceae bacterium]